MKKIKILSISLGCLAVLVCAIVLFSEKEAEPTDLYSVLGQSVMNVDQIESPENIVAYIDGEPFYYDYAQQSAQARNIAPEQLIEYAVKEELLYREAKNNGITVSQAELSQYIDGLREAVANDSDAYNSLLSYCQGANITVDDYWQLTYPVYEQIMIISKYQDSLYQSFQAHNEDASLTSFNEYYEQYQEGLMEQYNVVME